MRHIGVSNFDVAQLRRIQEIAPVETLQPQYSLIERDVEREILPFAERNGIGVIVYSPMGSGLLTGRDDPRADREHARRRLAQAGPALSRASSSRATSSSSIAWRRSPKATTPSPEPSSIAWTLRNPAVDGAIVGFRSPEQVDPLIDAANLELADEDISTIEGAQ